MLVAVYGTLRAGEYNHGFLLDSEFVGETYLQDLAMVSNGFFPTAFPRKGNRILVEVYRLSDEHILDDIDRLEGYDSSAPEKSMYLRKTVNTEFGEVYYYEYNQFIDSYDDGDLIEDWMNVA